MLFASLWAVTREKLKTALKEIKKQQRITGEVESEYVRAVDEAEYARVKHEYALAENKSAQMLAIQAAEEHVAWIDGKYSGIISQEEEISRLQNEAADLAMQIASVRHTYRQKRQTLDRLQEQVAIYDDRLAFAELGVYEPHFNFGDSEDFKKRILEVRERQKIMISSKL